MWRFAAILALAAVCAAQPPVPSVTNYRRLKPDHFSDLPRPIVSVLGARGCLIPQPSAGGPPRNVIHGEFFQKGQTAWAVVCSARGVSSILVFRGGADTHPAEVGKWPEDHYLQRGLNGSFFYAREINPVDRKFILEHYRAYGGPKPPPIDHQGIDDAMLGKASEVYYWYQGQWRKLTGAD
ncbi:MAG TPA: hypothetical protein VKX39_18310 [Bryobacteraceae bacterium]|jgi:hypothetical protein|nr:hypothetical protein [Bryobacteraceae bacterium]